MVLNPSSPLPILVDAADFETLSKFRWSVRWSHSRPYAIRKARAQGKQRTIFLHRLLMNAQSDIQIHHINRDTLDNRRANLIALSPSDHRAAHVGPTSLAPLFPDSA